LDIKVLNITDARCNHEAETGVWKRHGVQMLENGHVPCSN